MANPSRSSRNPDWSEGRQVDLCHPLGWERVLPNLGHSLENLLPLDAVAAP